MGPDTEDGRGASETLRIGRYRVDAVVGTGAFATVYRALDERLDDTVAVKVLAENHSLDLDLRERFLTEGRVLRRVTSPHVVTVHDLGETDRQQPYLVLEYADRGTLRHRVTDLMARGWRPGVADVWAVAEPLAEALGAVHRAGVVHRDLNPANVLLTARGAQPRNGQASVTAWDERLVLADLGLCKDLALNSGHTSAGGTEGFRPPELRRGPAVIDGRADLWSLSALVVWLVTGAPPGDLPAGVALAHSGLPPGLARALDRSLAADPAARHPDVHAWWAEVAAALAVPTGAFGNASPAAATGAFGTAAPAAATGAFGTAAPAAATGAFGTAAPAFPAPPHPLPSPAAAVDGWFPGRPTVAGFGQPSSTPVPGGRPVSSRSWGWRAVHSAWVLAALPLGFLTWAGFLYVGLSARRRAWLWAAGVYAVAAIAILVLVVASPVGPDGRIDDAAWQSIAGMVLLATTWFGGCAHALVANSAWLQWRSQHGP